MVNADNLVVAQKYVQLKKTAGNKQKAVVWNSSITVLILKD